MKVKCADIAGKSKQENLQKMSDIPLQLFENILRKTLAKIQENDLKEYDII
jgi:hypothetical protein